ncbi:Gfo/Idh/MocA family protein [Propionibacteriaceae bacterium Y2011]
MTRRAAVIGCGDISQLHFKSLDEANAELVAICDVDPDRLAAVVPDRQVERVSDHRQLLDRDDIDVVHICTPHNQHVPVALDFLAAGKHVLTEKPIAASLEEADELVQASKETDRKVGVCFQNRYNKPFAAAKEILDSGRLGAVLSAGASVLWHRTPEYYRARPWRGSREGSGGGVLINQAIHTIDMVQWLVGDVTEVTGSAGTYGLADVIEVEDTATVAMRHENGVRSVLVATNLNPVNAPVTIDIKTEKALVHLAGDLTITHDNGEVETVADEKVATGARAYWGTSHGLLVKAFHEHLDQPGPFWIDPVEGYKALWILKQVLGY